KAHRGREIHASTLGSFKPSSPASGADAPRIASTAELDPTRELAGVEDNNRNVESAPLIETTDLLEFNPWVRRTPLPVVPQLLSETIVDLFKQMG
ncbi:hypothetical protein FS749_008239, partial [Ceratobasidium sp. UAMH 11750]